MILASFPRVDEMMGVDCRYLLEEVLADYEPLVSHESSVGCCDPSALGVYFQEFHPHHSWRQVSRAPLR